LAFAVGTDPRRVILHFVQVDVEEVLEAQATIALVTGDGELLLEVSASLLVLDQFCQNKSVIQILRKVFCVVYLDLVDVRRDWVIDLTILTVVASILALCMYQLLLYLLAVVAVL